MLRAEAEQGAEDGPGWCRLRLHGLGHSSATVELMIRGPGASRPYLGRSDWEDSETWLEFPAAAEGETLMVRLGPPYTLRLGKVTTVEIRARIPGGADQRTRLAWPRIVLPAENDAKALAPTPPPLPPSPPLPSPPRPAAEPVRPGELRAAAAERSVVKRAPRRAPIRAAVAAAAAAALFLIAAAGAVWFLSNRDRPEHQPQTAEATSPAPARVFTEEAVRAFLAADPEGPSTTVEAILYEQAGRPDLALLLYRHAVRRGDSQAAVAIGRMYDPEGFDPKTSAFAVPNAEQAASFYEQAAEAGDAEAQFRLGRLLLSGRTAGDSDAERGAVWLQRAAAQGHAEAQAALERLQKQVQQ